MFCWISSLLVILQTLLLIMGDGENYDKVEEQTYSYYSSGRLQGGKIEQSGESRTCIWVYDKLNERYLCKNDRISSCNILDNNDELNIQLMQILLSKEIK